MTEYTYVATCLFGLERMLGEEIDALGYKRLETIDGRVIFAGDEGAVARCNLWLRTAERLFLLVGTTPAYTFDDLFEGVRAMPWEDFLGRDDAFPVSGHSVGSILTSIPALQSVIQKAIAERMKAAYEIDWCPANGVKMPIEFFLLKDKASLMLDLSGTALHKRGYRPAANAAPLRETLAAALVKIARPREDVLFWDPMCGSGTIPIEAALIMANIAPGLHRHFAAEEYDFLPMSIWTDAREEAKSAIRDTAFEAYASDIDPVCVELTKENCRRAGVAKWVKAFERNALEIKTGGRRGTVVCNPPYGERLFTVEQIEKLYRDMGRHFATLDNWQIYILTSHESFERLYGRRADKVRKLYNGMIKCGYYQYFKKPDGVSPSDKPDSHRSAGKYGRKESYGKGTENKRNADS
ncbi:MAG: class I SAM-dependent RNA methyltransferase [Eubacteriales bacterium]